MRVEFLKEFEAKTATGTRTIAAGTVLDLGEDKACKLIAVGIAKVFAVEPSFNPCALPYLDRNCRLVIPFDCPPKYRYWAGGQGIAETLREIFEKRAAAMEFDGDLAREQSEAEAVKIMARYVRDNSKSNDP